MGNVPFNAPGRNIVIESWLIEIFGLSGDYFDHQSADAARVNPRLDDWWRFVS